MSAPESRYSRVTWSCATALVCALGILFVYWPVVRSGFAFVSSDIYDGKIMIAMLEHWHNVYQLKENPLNPIYFHPFTGALAYNESNLISGALYTVFRALGADAFLAYELLNWTVRIIGAVSSIILARKIFGLGLFYSLATGFLFLIVTNLALRMAHSQLLFASFFPLGLLLFSATFDRMASLDVATRRWPTMLMVLGFAAFIALWALTAFYSLYIFCLFLAVYFVALNTLDLRIRGTSVKILFAHPLYVFSGLGALGLAIAGVLLIYGRALGHSHRVEEIRYFAGDLFDLLNVGTGNALWSAFLAPVYQNFTGRPLVSSELSTGFTPFLLFTFVASVVWLVQTYRGQRLRTATFALALSIACAIVVLLCLKFGNRAIWEPFFAYVPGAKALRVPMRFLLFITPIVIAISMIGLSRLPTSLAAVLLLLIIVEQVRTDRPFLINRTAELEFLRGIPKAPPQCRSFYVSVPRLPPTGNGGIDAFYSHSVDAMLIAELRKIPTLNGMTTFTPEGWDLHTPYAPDYRDRVLRYAERMGVQDGLCSLDLRKRAWGPA